VSVVRAPFLTKNNKQTNKQTNNSNMDGNLVMVYTPDFLNSVMNKTKMFSQTTQQQQQQQEQATTSDTTMKITVEEENMVLEWIGKHQRWPRVDTLLVSGKKQETMAKLRKATLVVSEEHTPQINDPTEEYMIAQTLCTMLRLDSKHTLERIHEIVPIEPKLRELLDLSLIAMHESAIACVKNSDNHASTVKTTTTTTTTTDNDSSCAIMNGTEPVISAVASAFKDFSTSTSKSFFCVFAFVKQTRRPPIEAEVPYTLYQTWQHIRSGWYFQRTLYMAEIISIIGRESTLFEHVIDRLESIGAGAAIEHSLIESVLYRFAEWLSFVPMYTPQTTAMHLSDFQSDAQHNATAMRPSDQRSDSQQPLSVQQTTVVRPHPQQQQQQQQQQHTSMVVPPPQLYQQQQEQTPKRGRPRKMELVLPSVTSVRKESTRFIISSICARQVQHQQQASFPNTRNDYGMPISFYSSSSCSSSTTSPSPSPTTTTASTTTSTTNTTITNNNKEKIEKNRFISGKTTTSQQLFLEPPPRSRIAGNMEKDPCLSPGLTGLAWYVFKYKKLPQNVENNQQQQQGKTKHDSTTVEIEKRAFETLCQIQRGECDFQDPHMLYLIRAVGVTSLLVVPDVLQTLTLLNNLIKANILTVEHDHHQLIVLQKRMRIIKARLVVDLKKLEIANTNLNVMMKTSATNSSLTNHHGNDKSTDNSDDDDEEDEHPISEQMGDAEDEDDIYIIPSQPQQRRPVTQKRSFQEEDEDDEDDETNRDAKRRNTNML